MGRLGGPSIPLAVALAVDNGSRSAAQDVAFFKLGFGGAPVIYPGTYDLLPEGLAGRAIRHALRHAERWRGVVHRISGRRG